MVTESQRKFRWIKYFETLESAMSFDYLFVYKDSLEREIDHLGDSERMSLECLNEYIDHRNRVIEIEMSRGTYENQ